MKFVARRPLNYIEIMSKIFLYQLKVPMKTSDIKVRTETDFSMYGAHFLGSTKFPSFLLLLPFMSAF
jgi:hypothetical protein